MIGADGRPTAPGSSSTPGRLASGIGWGGRASDLPIACTLPTDALRAGAGELLPGLFATALERRELTDGAALRFDAADGVLETMTAVIERERRCCAFLRFRVTVEPGAGPVWLEVTGPSGTREFLLQLAEFRDSVSDGLDLSDPGGVP